ncbi:MAG: hypothetical protein ACLGHN_05605 [Bacteriovoracia bacterium]
MKSQNTKSSNELQKEVHKEIRNVKRDLDEIQGRLSPGQIIDDAIFYPHGRSLGSTFDHLKRNPVGTTFLSLGTILLMEDETHKTYETSAKTKFSSAKTDLNTRVQTMKENVKAKIPHKDPTAPGIGEKLKNKVQGVKEGLSSKAGEIKENVQSKATEVQENLQHQSSDMRADAEAAFSNLDVQDESSGAFNKDKVKEKISDFAESGKSKVKDLDPMAYMALGAGLGALTGASLPVGNKEEEFVDSKLSDKFSNLSDEIQQAINESSNILKDLVIQDVKDFDLKVFR